uniref:Uncharacterized protein n=1 Tax=Globodera rostochiensis TaxID=31243 RepID=A0A914HZE6_GLORO
MQERNCRVGPKRLGRNVWAGAESWAETSGRNVWDRNVWANVRGRSPRAERRPN